MAKRPDINEYVDALLKSKEMGSSVLYHTVTPGIGAEYSELEKPFSKSIRTVMEKNEWRRLFTHQAVSLNRIRSGRHIVLATPTASGKTLVYTLPAIETIQTHQGSRALFIYPLKALAQDQLRHFNHLAAGFERDKPTAGIYDGDTRMHLRKQMRENLPDILMTNPDMVHLSILPYHHNWSEFLKNLKYVVLDEMHVYRGMFGAHIAWVLRRLRRICAYYHAFPTFVFCSATIGNPAQLAEQLSGLSPESVIDSSEPRGKRHLLFLDSPEGAVRSTIKLVKAALHRKIRTIVYTQSRKLAELITLWTKQQNMTIADRVRVYRAGLTPAERRSIERGLATGRLLAVVSTSALELGIDIGDLDLSILVGYPGSIMSTRQRGGRAGRNGRDAAVILVAGDDALDQYFMRHPTELVEKEPELAVVNPFNPVVMSRHLVCAAAELPIQYNEEVMHSEAVKTEASALARRGELFVGEEGKNLYLPQRNPQRDVDLRSAGNRLRIFEARTKQLLGEIDYHRALRETHPGAVYLHGSEYYVVTDLNLHGGTVTTEKVIVDYYTRVRSFENIEIEDTIDQKRYIHTPVFFGRLTVTEQVNGYDKRQLRNGKLMETVDLDLPPQIFETEGMWYTVSHTALKRLVSESIDLSGSIHAMEHAAIGILPLIVLADRNDFGGVSTLWHHQTGHATVFIYDGIPGGAGLCRMGYERFGEVLEKTLGVIERCGCKSGCPTCVQSPKCGSGNRPMDKAGAQAILLDLVNSDKARPVAAQRIANSSFNQQEPGATGARVEILEAEREGGEGGPPSGSFGPTTGNREGMDRPAGKKRRGEKEGSSRANGNPNCDSGFCMPHYGVFDIETQRSAADVGGWHRADQMKVSCAVVFDSESGRFRTYTEDLVPLLIRDLYRYDVVVGFNSKRFDYKVLSGYEGFDPSKVQTLDILEDVYRYLGFRLSLNHLAKVTLGIEKSADGLQALKWWQEGRFQEITDYCRRDVDITHQIFRFGRDKGYLLFKDKSENRVRIPVNW